MDTTLVIGTLKAALSTYPAPECFNSDQGSQYTSHKHTELLKNHRIKISMNGRGRSIDIPEFGISLLKNSFKKLLCVLNLEIKKY
ncbi:DDE-type integrase/transposase/recombinase [Cardinium endosymbiont of Oedothorax gibbosus]|uniref:DDE-type integrase/transposase/recombinase n=1 Tax=Cardinium endosymbiont of Oedothorax gibbosus TaxID=931101 RepID=UPI002024E1C1|nr:DDE-type integrase/transposase/recombinase [Cardinium endosymbiont of Oedothorax gibbosus]